MVNSTDSNFQSRDYDDHSNHLRREASSGDRRLDRLKRRADDGDPSLVNTMLDSGASDHFGEKGSDRFPDGTHKIPRVGVSSAAGGSKSLNETGNMRLQLIDVNGRPFDATHAAMKGYAYQSGVFKHDLISFGRLLEIPGLVTGLTLRKRDRTILMDIRGNDGRLHVVQVYTRNGMLHMLERRNTSTTVNHVSAADVPTEDHADREGIRDGRLPPHVCGVSKSKDVPLLRRYISGSITPNTVQPEDNMLRMLRMDSCSSAAKELCKDVNKEKYGRQRDDGHLVLNVVSRTKDSSKRKIGPPSQTFRCPHCCNCCPTLNEVEVEDHTSNLPEGTVPSFEMLQDLNLTASEEKSLLETGLTTVINGAVPSVDTSTLACNTHVKGQGDTTTTANIEKQRLKKLEELFKRLNQGQKYKGAHPMLRTHAVDRNKYHAAVCDTPRRKDLIDKEILATSNGRPVGQLFKECEVCALNPYGKPPGGSKRRDPKLKEAFSSLKGGAAIVAACHTFVNCTQVDDDGQRANQIRLELTLEEERVHTKLYDTEGQFFEGQVTTVGTLITDGNEWHSEGETKCQSYSEGLIHANSLKETDREDIELHCGIDDEGANLGANETTLVKSCPKGHELVETSVDGKNDIVRCDMATCGKQIELGQLSLHCNTCKWDACKACATIVTPDGESKDDIGIVDPPSSIQENHLDDLDKLPYPSFAGAELGAVLEVDTTSHSYDTIAGNRYEFVGYVRGARLVHSVETRDKSAESAIAAVTEMVEYFHRYIPKIGEIITDDDRAYNCDAFKGVMKEMDILVHPHAPENPQETGGVERANRAKAIFVARALTRSALPGDAFRGVFARHWVMCHNHLHIPRGCTQAPIPAITNRLFAGMKHLHVPGSIVYVHDVPRTINKKVGTGERIQKHDVRITEMIYVTFMDTANGIIAWDIGAGRLQKVSGRAYTCFNLVNMRREILPCMKPYTDGSVDLTRLPALEWNRTSITNAYKRGILTLESLPLSEKRRLLAAYARKRVMIQASEPDEQPKPKIIKSDKNGVKSSLTKKERLAMAKRMDSHDLIGAGVNTFFPGHGYFDGTVTQVTQGAHKGAPSWYKLRYSDGDELESSLQDLITKHNLTLPTANLSEESANAVYEVIEFDEKNLAGPNKISNLAELRAIMSKDSRIDSTRKQRSKTKAKVVPVEALDQESKTDKVVNLVCLKCKHRANSVEDMTTHIEGHVGFTYASIVGTLHDVHGSSSGGSKKSQAKLKPKPTKQKASIRPSAKRAGVKQSTDRSDAAAKRRSERTRQRFVKPFSHLRANNIDVNVDENGSANVSFTTADGTITQVEMDLAERTEDPEWAEDLDDVDTILLVSIDNERQFTESQCNATKMYGQAFTPDAPNVKKVLDPGHPEHRQWVQGILQELNGLVHKGVLEGRLLKELTGEQRRNLLQMKLILKRKYSAIPGPDGQPLPPRYKARLVVRGDLSDVGKNGEQGRHGTEVETPGSQPSSLRVCCAQSVLNNHPIVSFDIEQAYCQSECQEVPGGLHASGAPGTKELMKNDQGDTLIYKICKNIYGMVTAAGLHFKSVIEMLRKLGYTQADGDQTLFRNKEQNTTVFVYVDDGALVGPTAIVLELVRMIEKRFDLGMKDFMSEMLGSRIVTTTEEESNESKQDETEEHEKWHDNIPNAKIKSIKQDLTQYTKDLLKSTPVGQGNYYPRSTPIDIALGESLEDNLPNFVNSYADRHVRNLTDKESEDYEEMKREYDFTNIVYRMLWISRISRPDLSLAVSVVSKHLLGPPCYDAMRALRQMLQYLLGTVEMGIIFHADGNRTPIYYCDSNHPMGRPRLGYLCRLADGPLDWGSKLAPVCSESTTESEIYAASEGLRKGTVIHADLLHVDIVSKDDLMAFYGDNDACTTILAKSKDALSVRAKHIGSRLYKAMERCSPDSEHRTATMERVGTNDNLSDFFTKFQSRALFISMRDMIMGISRELSKLC